MMKDNENEKHETSADIANEIRRAVESMGDELPYTVPAGTMRRVADRIEAAWKRESKAIATENVVLPAVCITKPQGNAAAMREALVAVKKSIDGIGESSLDCDPTILMVALTQVCARLSAQIERALSAPARNCDMYDNWYDAHQAWERLQKDELDYFVDENGVRECEQAWLFAPAERKGNGDGCD